MPPGVRLSGRKGQCGMDQRLVDPVDLADVGRGLEQHSRHLRLLATAVHEINRINDIPLILQRLVEVALQLTDAGCGAAGVMNGQHMAFQHYLANGEWRGIDFTFAPGYGVPGQVILTKRPYLSNHAATDPHVIPEIREALQIYNLLNCPILSADDELLGSFEIHNTRDYRPFDAHDQMMLETLAAAASIAMQNARNTEARVQAQDALTNSEQRYQALLEGASDAILVADASTGILLEVNQKAQQLTGRTREELVGQPQTLLHPEELAHYHRARFAENGVAGHTVHTDALLVHKDGRRIPVEIGATVIELGDQRLIQGIFRDLSQNLITQEKLRRYAKLYEATSEGIVITDATRGIVDVNPAFCQVTGYRREEVIGKNPSMLQSGRHDAAFYQAMWESIKATGHWRGEVWNRRKNGEIYPEWLSINAVYDEKGEIVNFVGVFTDISTIKESQERLQRLAHHDPLTDLPNKLLFGARLSHALHRGHRDQTMVAVLFLDLDRFKNVNDTLGHPAGDKLLCQVAARLKLCVREDDTVARLGGDEFTIILENVKDARDIVPVAQKVIDALKTPFSLSNQDLFITVSIGISVFPEDGTDNDTLLKNADSAMYCAKDHGRNNYQFYTRELTQEACERLALETSLRRALEHKEFELHYQPQYCLRREALVGAEALVRWRHPELGMVSPARFIPIAEEIGLIEPLGRWILDTVCTQARFWDDAGFPAIVIAVNLSAMQIMRGSVVQTVRDCLTAAGIPGNRLELELTESVFMGRRAQVVETLDALKELGVSLAIDDFGTGYSSLRYLKRLPIDKLKIDQSFVHEIPGDENDATIARAIMALGRSMQMVVIAEGVETREQEEFLRQEDCDCIQGYRFGRPVAAAVFERFLRNPNGLLNSH